MFRKIGQKPKSYFFEEALSTPPVVTSILLITNQRTTCLESDQMRAMCGIKSFSTRQPYPHTWLQFNCTSSFTHHSRIPWEIILQTEHSTNTVGSCDGLIRGSDGEWIVGFYRRLGAVSALETELCALKEGLQLALDTNLIPLSTVEMDAKMAIQLIMNNKKPEA
ncbi:hypothetical protein Acr_14g0001360 [Actinidia rufa]|uniref:RNase H type-1 domain-containing protein n=1 Tax=Actinidia rufa TaxID=165716 RepID=A0A7J0FPC7_9ERIC|nr:hypothetical protein Acr_14g0001360 [Actinidia rufa]